MTLKKSGIFVSTMSLSYFAFCIASSLFFSATLAITALALPALIAAIGVTAGKLMYNAGRTLEEGEAWVRNSVETVAQAADQHLPAIIPIPIPIPVPILVPIPVPVPILIERRVPVSVTITILGQAAIEEREPSNEPAAVHENPELRARPHHSIRGWVVSFFRPANHLEGNEDNQQTARRRYSIS